MATNEANDTSKASLDPIYYTDDYAREECLVTINVGSDRCSMRIFAPSGEILECYNPHTVDVPAMMEIWLSGKVPGKRAMAEKAATAMVESAFSLREGWRLLPPGFKITPLYTECPQCGCDLTEFKQAEGDQRCPGEIEQPAKMSKEKLVLANASDDYASEAALQKNLWLAWKHWVHHYAPSPRKGPSCATRFSLQALLAKLPRGRSKNRP